MSPILVRPVREQLEHDRIIRLLQSKSRRKFDASMNPGAEQNAPVKAGTTLLYPDVLLFSQERGQAAAGGDRGRDRRIGQPPRGAGPVGALCPAAGRILPVCARGHGRRRAPTVRGQPDSRRTKSGAITWSAIRCASPWCTVAARRRSCRALRGGRPRAARPPVELPRVSIGEVRQPGGQARVRGAARKRR